MTTSSATVGTVLHHQVRLVWPGLSLSNTDIFTVVADRKPEDSYKSASSLAPGSVKEVNQSLSSALSAAGIKPSGGSADSVPGYVRPGVGSSQRSPGPMITKSDTLGYNSQAYYQGQSNPPSPSHHQESNDLSTAGDRQSASGKSNYNSYGGQGGYDRQNSSGYSGSNGLSSTSYPGQGTGGGGSYSSGQNTNYSNSGYSSSQANNFSSSGNYSSFSSSTGHSGECPSSLSSSLVVF